MYQRRGLLPFLMAHIRARQKAARGPEQSATNDYQKQVDASHKMLMKVYGSASDDSEADIPDADYGQALAKALMSLQKGD